MIFLFFAWLLLGGCGFLIGNAVLNQLNLGRYLEKAGDRLIVDVWLGILIFAFLLLGFSTLTPLTPLVGIATVVFLVVMSLSQQRNRVSLRNMVRSLSRSTILWFCALAFGVAAYSSQMVFLTDTGLYHFQLIKWLSQFGTVPGLALFHERFGFTSSWFALAAPFNHGILEGHIAAMTGGFAMLLWLLHFVIAFNRIIKQQALYCDWYIVVTILLLLPMILEWGVPVSSSPDLPIIALVLLVSWVILIISDAREQGAHSTDKVLNACFVPFILSVGATTVKLSALPLLIVSGMYCLLSAPHNIKKLALIAGIASFFLLPFMAVGTVSSGCPLYPSSLFCTDLPWSIGSERAQEMTKILIEWARWGGPTPEGATALNWLLPSKTWGVKFYLRFALILLSFVSLALLLTTRLREKRIFPDKYAIGVGALGVAFIIFSSPAFHYGLGYLVVLPGLLIAANFQSYNSAMAKLGEWRRYVPAILVGLLTCVVGVHYVVSYKSQGFLYNKDREVLSAAINEKRVHSGDNPNFNLMLPPRLLSISLIVEPFTREPDDVSYFRPKDDGDGLCWDSPLPCTDGILRNVKLRNKEKGIKAGFVNG
jgi:hypothetical protein